jgi:glycosyltransferase involved in cell wall biosynthesis
MMGGDRVLPEGGARHPLVSVIVPVRNGEATIERCVAALLGDSYPAEQREIVVVDNGSDDRTGDLVRRFPVRLVREPRRGLSEARNRGIEVSRGEIVAFTDSDCYVSNRWLTELMAGFGGDEETEVMAVTGDVVPYPPRSAVERFSAARKPSTNAWQRSTHAPWFNFMNTALRREVFEHVGLFDTSLRGAGEDLDFAWRFFEARLRLVRRPVPVVFHSQRSTALALFRQQLRNGRSWAVLRRKHSSLARWSWHDELRAWRDLAGSAADAARACMPGPAKPRGPREVDHYYLEFLSKLGQRLGFVDGHIRGPGRWFGGKRGLSRATAGGRR